MLPPSPLLRNNYSMTKECGTKQKDNPAITPGSIQSIKGNVAYGQHANKITQRFCERYTSYFLCVMCQKCVLLYGHTQQLFTITCISTNCLTSVPKLFEPKILLHFKKLDRRLKIYFSRIQTQKYWLGKLCLQTGYCQSNRTWT